MKKRSLLSLRCCSSPCALSPVWAFLRPAGGRRGERILPAAPVIAADGDFNPDFLAETAAYVNGRFSFRLEGITAWAKLNAALFCTSTAENVLLGRDGWLFYAPTIHDYTGDAPMTARELYCAARTLYLLQEYAENRGGDFLFTAAPNKNTLYPEYMPARTRLGSVSDMDALYALLDEMGFRISICAMYSHRKPSRSISKRTATGTRRARRSPLTHCSLLSAASDYFSGTVSAGNTHRGDLYEMLYPAGKELEEDFAYAPGFSFTANTDNPDRVTITTESGVGTGALLCYRDSFGRNLYPYLAESFASAEFSRRNEYTAATLPGDGTLVIELVERNLRYLVEYDSLAPHRAGRHARRDGRPGRWESRFDGERRYGRVHALFRHMGRRDAGRCVQCLRSLDGVLYEAVPRPDGFIVSLPDGSTIDAVYAAAEGTFPSIRRLCYRLIKKTKGDKTT